MVIPLIWRSPNLILIILGGMAIKYFLVIMTHHYDIISGMFKSFGVTVSQSEWVCVQVRIDSDLSARHSRRRPGPDRLAVFYQLVSLSIFWPCQTHKDFSKSICLSLYIACFLSTDLTKTLFADLFSIFHLVSPSLPSEGTNKPKLGFLVWLSWNGRAAVGRNQSGPFFLLIFKSGLRLIALYCFFSLSLNCECRLGPCFQFISLAAVNRCRLSSLFFFFSLLSLPTHTQHTQAQHTLAKSPSERPYRPLPPRNLHFR